MPSSSIDSCARLYESHADYLELDAGKARDIDYGYTADAIKGVTADRLLITGDASHLAQEHEAFARLSPLLRDLTICTSDSRDIGINKLAPNAELVVAPDGMAPDIKSNPVISTPEISLEELGIGL